jgi:hypothetical protein
LWLGLEPGRKCNLPLGLLFWYMKFMTKSISRTRKTRGRPPTGAESIHLRVLPEQSAEVDAWIAKQKEQRLTRPEAIRRLVELGLAGAKKFAAPSQQTRAKAKKFAAEQIDRMGNSTATAEEQASRKQRLLKGPEEFREARVDRPKAKRK